MPGRGALLASAWVGALAVACSGGEGVPPPTTPTTVPAPATTAPPPTTARTPAPTSPVTTGAVTTPVGDEVTLHASGVHLAEVGDAFRVVVHSDAPRLTVTVRSSAPPPLRVCPVAGLDAATQAAACVAATAGAPVNLPLAPSYTGVEVARTGGGAATLDEVAVVYRPRDRGMEIRLPAMAPGAPAAGTLFRLTPPAAGSFRATAQWSGPGGQQPPRGELTVEEGPAANRRLVARAEGAPGGRVSATPTSPVELWLTVRASGDAALVAPTLTVTWPS